MVPHIEMNVWVCEIATVGRVVPDMMYVYFGTNYILSCFNSHNDFQLYATLRNHTSAIKDRTRANYISYIQVRRLWVAYYLSYI